MTPPPFVTMSCPNQVLVFVTQLGAAFCYPIGFQLGADFKYKIEQKSCGWEMVRLFTEMVRLLNFFQL